METSSAIQKSNGVALSFGAEQVALIKRTVAPDATDDELKLFLHVAAQSHLDPLRRQIHFTKRQGRIVIIADVNGLQARAAKEGDYLGIQHAVVYAGEKFKLINGETVEHESNPFASGQIIGAWATVSRKGMRPFTAVVKVSEYTSASNPIWKTMPAVMIDKVAKSTALRLAYPEQLGNIYDPAELDKSDETPPDPPKDTRTEQVKAVLAAKLAEQAAPRVVEAEVVNEPPPDDVPPPTEEWAQAAPVEESRPADPPKHALSGAVVPFGKNKDTPVEALTERQINAYMEIAQKDLGDPSKSKYHPKTREWLGALTIERDRRGFAPT